jgi:hypothetical protein
MDLKHICGIAPWRPIYSTLQLRAIYGRPMTVEQAALYDSKR